MDKEQVKELNEIRKYLDISCDDFVKIMALAKMRQKRSSIEISDEMLCEIISEALLGIDYDISEGKTNLFFDSVLKKKKTPEEAFIRALRDLNF